jgi:hypothetical protein
LADAMDGRRLALPRGPGLTCSVDFDPVVG